MCVRLDAFHAMQRLSKLVLKSHGACSAYLARLRDAFFMVNADDLAAAEADLRHKGMSQEDVDGKKVRDWPYSFRGAEGDLHRGCLLYTSDAADE